MTPTFIFWTIIVISVVSFVFDQILEYLNLRYQRAELPTEVASFYDRDKYLKSLDYQKTQTRFSFVSGTFSFLLSLGFLAWGGYGWVDGLLRTYIDNEMLLTLSFFAILLLSADILTLPFQLYSVFKIEEQFGFNKTTPGTFLADKLKGYLMGSLLGGGLLLLLLYLIHLLGTNFWIWFGCIASVFILFMNMFYTTLILPLFNKLTPLADGELKMAIQEFASKVQFPLENIYVMDGSKRSKKANAFFSGIGSKKKIVLFDTLIENHTKEELVAVLAHEVGHFKKRHIVWSYFISIAQVFFILFVLSWMIQNESLSIALGGSQLALHLNLLAFGILFSPISGLTGLFMTMLSRKNEFEADQFAKDTYSGPALAKALKKLSVDSLSNLYPHPLYVFFHYSHPPLLQRLEALQR